MRKMKLVLSLTALCAALGLCLFVQGDVAAATLESRLQVNINSVLTNTSGLTTASAPLQRVWTMALPTGVGASQSDKLYTLSNEPILTGATLSIDVKAALTDAFGAAFTPAKLRVVYIYASTANTTDLTLFGDANSVPILDTAATTTVLKAGGLFLKAQPAAAGIAVTAGTGDIIKIVNAAGATAYVDVVLIGTSS
jgi:hypothetical protein